MEKKQNIPKKEKILEFLKKYSPYRKILRNEDTGKVLDKQSFVHYQKLVQWVVDIILNGLFLWFPLFAFGLQPLHPIIILGDGVAVWFFFQALKKFMETIKI